MSKLKHTFIYYVATGLGLGLIPVASGTFGTLLGVVLVVFLFPASYLLQLLLVLLLTALAIYAANWMAETEDDKDPSIVVIDEIVGLLFTFLFLPIEWLTWPVLLVGFLLFRALDIWKPGPIRKCESLPGGFGIVLDDVAAGIAANIVLQIWLRVFA